MCSLTLNKTSDEKLGELRQDGKKIVDRLVKMASQANPDVSGLLDTTDTHIKRMPEDLRAVRKRTIGRHRIYYVGHHTQCSYTILFVKAFKKSGVDDDDDKGFQQKLIGSLSDPVSREFPEVDEKKLLGSS